MTYKNANNVILDLVMDTCTTQHNSESDYKIHTYFRQIGTSKSQQILDVLT